MDGYNRGGHSKYSMKVHLIFVTKYRRELFQSRKRADDVKHFLYDAARKYGCTVIQIETDKDPVHILLGYNPNVSVSYIVKQLKQHSTYYMWKNHGNYLSKQYWKQRVLWSDGYFACSIGQVSQAVIEKYIQNQG
ncbi:IS200/IS605 family transposase [Ruminococcus sp. CLA-AA-H200]|uniref:IS200/IS605 family transposase n=1 Tax=Ruminococcus turbiniformis TaxID=2881258 RepID=A0ABS8FX72_9FIRM|nr:IS200/IS605 family transposase [Ruminococcus turbiniformis]MCC2254552.1 IS200/IS605 family transposase [Ruminococcus turbiniformis]